MWSSFFNKVGVCAYKAKECIEGGVSYLKTNQPVDWTGSLRHALKYPLADLTCQEVYHNPKYKSSSKPSVVIYCIHGTGDRFNAFETPIEKMLPDLPPEVSCIRMIKFNKRGQGLSIQEFGEQLAQQVLANGDEDVFFMGHSRGTLVIESAIMQLDKVHKEEKFRDKNNNEQVLPGKPLQKVKVHGIAAVGGPYRGSWWAMKPWTWFSKSVKQMQMDPNDGQRQDTDVTVAAEVDKKIQEKDLKYIKKLKEYVKHSSIPRSYHAAKNDSLVTEDSVTIPEHKEFRKDYDRHGHLSILLSNRLVKSVLKQIKKILSPLYTDDEGVELSLLSASTARVDLDISSLPAESKEPVKLREIKEYKGTPGKVEVYNEETGDPFVMVEMPLDPTNEPTAELSEGSGDKNSPTEKRKLTEETGFEFVEHETELADRLTTTPSASPSPGRR